MIELPEGTAAILNDEALALKLHTTMVLITAEFDAGTVYTVFEVFAVGLDCPKILYVIAIDYIPANKKGLKVSTDSIVIEVFVVLIAADVISTQ